MEILKMLAGIIGGNVYTIRDFMADCIEADKTQIEVDKENKLNETIDY